MAEFRSHRSYWDFATTVSRRWRYALPAEQVQFLQTVLETSADKEEDIRAGSFIFRAQVGHRWEPQEVAPGITEEFECPFDAERMKPLRDRAYEGRANPKGIPCLYVATHQLTAIAETRPWVGALVTVAELRTARLLRVLNCTTDDQKTKIYFDEPAPEERQRVVWIDIDRAFAEPVSRIDDDVASYAPTQMLAEQFRQRGLDGIGYRSAAGLGHNIALFDLDSADVMNCTLFRVDGLKLESSQAGNTYFITKHYPSLKAKTPKRKTPKGAPTRPHRRPRSPRK